MRVLVIEDESRMARAMKESLKAQHLAVDICGDVANGQTAAVDSDYDLILLDRRLPDGDGLSICRYMRQHNVTTPVIILTAHGEVVDKISGLQAGADDYLVKPFSVDELLARIQAIMRRPKAYRNSVLKVQDVQVDTQRHEVRRAGTLVPLLPKEYAMLVCLAEHQNILVTKDFLIRHLWDGEEYVTERTIEGYISSLRKKLEKQFAGRPPLIRTVWGAGYRLEGKS